MHNQVREWLLLFGAEYFVFQFAIQNSKDEDIYNYNFARCPVWVWIQNSKDEDIYNYNFARCPVWVWNLVADIEGGT